MPEIKFHKMEGAGNDFVIIDNREYGLLLKDIIELTPKICNRRFGVGSDGILVLEPTKKPEVDFTMIYRNADGSDAGMCGNGARCLAMYAFKKGFNATQTFNVHDQLYKAEIHKNRSVSIHFPTSVEPEKITVGGTVLIKADAGTEHLVAFMPKKELENEENLLQLGRKLRYDAKVNPPGTNINFVHCDSSSSISLQTYERGVENLTLACGTGALASAIATHYQHEFKETHANYQVHVKGGTLQTSFVFNPDTNVYHHLILTGPAHFVFEGIYTV